MIGLFRATAAALLILSGLGPVATARATDSSGYTFVHDPSMIKEGHTYYLFSTGAPDGAVGNGNVQIRSSTDLRRWRYRGTIFAVIPGWVTRAVGPLLNLWAPDVSYYRGRYQVYYAGSTFGTRNSVIGLATNTTLDPAGKAYHWVDRGLVFRSTAQDDYNAIDPNFTLDASGHPWLAFGSFWSGIKLLPLALGAEKPLNARAAPYSLAYRPESNAVEAPYIIYRRPYYYLFVSFDRCCQGTASTYRVMVGRAKSITGPYLDRAGERMDSGGGTQLLAGAGYVRGPGGQSVLKDGAGYLLVFHFYDGRDNGNPKVGVRRLQWTADGWPRLGLSLTA